jgi:hypothetical protein
MIYVSPCAGTGLRTHRWQRFLAKVLPLEREGPEPCRGHERSARESTLPAGVGLPLRSTSATGWASDATIKRSMEIGLRQRSEVGKAHVSSVAVDLQRHSVQFAELVDVPE